MIVATGAERRMTNVDQREEVAHVLGATADEQLPVARLGQQSADASLSPHPILPSAWCQHV
jgi:hypothetical protein